MDVDVIEGCWDLKGYALVSEVFSKIPLEVLMGLCLENHQRVLVLKVVVVVPERELGSESGHRAKSISLRKRRSSPRRDAGEAHRTSELEQTGASEELPQGTSLAAAGPGVVVQPQELNGGDVTHGLTGQLCQGVVEEEEHGQPAQVTESTAIDLTDPVVVQQQTVEVDQAMEHVLGQSADAVAVQEELAKVDQVSEEIVLDEVELVLLQVEEISGCRACGRCHGEGRPAAAVHVEALELLQAAESSTLKALQVRVVTQIELLQITHLAECTALNPGNVVGEEPQNLVCDEVIDRKEKEKVEGDVMRWRYWEGIQICKYLINILSKFIFTYVNIKCYILSHT